MSRNLILIIAILIANTCFAQTKVPGRDPIKPDGIIWKNRVWRQIEIYERNNLPLRNDPAMPKENVFANILLSGIRSGVIKAYSDSDTSYVSPLSVQAINALINWDPASLSKLSRAWLNRPKHPNDPVSYDTSAVASCAYPDQIEFYCIKEDWVFDRNKGEMIVRIIAIAPAANSAGQVKPLFWLHYQDITSYINKFNAFKGKEMMNMSWAQYFDSRQFTSKITKVEGPLGSESNPKDRKHKKHKKQEEEEEFSGEHDMWVY